MQEFSGGRINQIGRADTVMFVGGAGDTGVMRTIHGALSVGRDTNKLKLFQFISSAVCLAKLLLR